jgi:hypothetical protein
MSTIDKSINRNKRSVKRFRFSIRALVLFTMAVATACAIVRAVGVAQSLRNVKDAAPFLLGAAQVAQLMRRGPKQFGAIATLSILSLKSFFWHTGSVRDAPEPSLFMEYSIYCFIAVTFVCWAYFSARAILSRSSANLAISMLSLLWLLDSDILRSCDHLQVVVAARLGFSAPASRPFMFVSRLIWGA